MFTRILIKFYRNFLQVTESAFIKTTPIRNPKIITEAAAGSSKTNSNELLVTTPELPKNQSMKSKSSAKYRLSLNRKICEQYTKKRLSFIAKAEALSESAPDSSTAPTTQLQIEDLHRQIISVKEKIATAQRRNNEIQQLEDVTELWRRGFREALIRLRDQYNPPSSLECILTALNIPLDLVNYI